MKWINPRNRLPEVNDLVWVVTTHNKNATSYKNTNIHIAQTCIDGSSGERFVSSFPYGKNIFFYNRNRKPEELIFAWALYEPNKLPEIEHLSEKESLELMEKDHYMMPYKPSNEAWGSRKLKFIACKDAMPNKNGPYAVVCSKGIGIVHYNGQSNGYWLMPNGMNEKITHWFPLPGQLPS
jgi:hypothetical protein